MKSHPHSHRSPKSIVIALSLAAVLLTLVRLPGAPIASVAAQQPILIERPQSSTIRSLQAELQFNRLIARARTLRSVRVIVEMGLPRSLQVTRFGSPEEERQAHLAAIAEAQTSLINRVAASDEGAVKRFTNFPLLAFNADLRQLLLLRGLRDVVYIEESVPVAPSLAESVRLIEADAAAIAGHTGAGQTIVVIDTGVDSNHPSLRGKVVSEACYSTTDDSRYSSSLCPEGAASSISEGSAQDCATDIAGCGHGTHVAGIAAGRGENFSGVARDANLIAIQAFSRIDDEAACREVGGSPCVLSFTEDYNLALDRVLTLTTLRNDAGDPLYRIAAVNLSLSGEKFTASCDGECRSTAMLINALRQNGIATIVAAGNDGQAGVLSAPACISSAISVGSTTKQDQVASTSNFSNHLSLFAPGEAIVSAAPGEGVRALSGTSMAAAHVAGAWAVFKSQPEQAEASVDDVLARFQATGATVTYPEQIDPAFYAEAPRINLARAIGLAEANLQVEVAPLSDPAISGRELTYVITITNHGPDAASLVTLTISVPAGAQFVSCTATEGSDCGGQGAERTVVFPSLAASETAIAQLSVRVDCPGDEPLGSRVEVISANVDPDRSNNTAETVTRVFDTPPSISGLKPDRAMLFPANGSLKRVKIDYEVSDNCDPAPVCALVVALGDEINSAERPVSARDAQVIDNRTVLLRAEPDQNTSRYYVITVSCSDNRGGLSQSRTRVTVPRPQP